MIKVATSATIKEVATDAANGEAAFMFGAALFQVAVAVAVKMLMLHQMLLYLQLLPLMQSVVGLSWSMSMCSKSLLLG